MTHTPQPPQPQPARPAGLFARKGEALPAALLSPGDPGRPGGGGGLALTADRGSPLAFLIQRRPASPRGAAGAPPSTPMPPTVLADAPPPPPEAAAEAAPPATAGAGRRPLTVRLQQPDFARLRAIAAAASTTYQSLLEAGVLRLLADQADQTATGKPPCRRR